MTVCQRLTIRQTTTKNPSKHKNTRGQALGPAASLVEEPCVRVDYLGGNFPLRMAVGTGTWV